MDNLDLTTPQGRGQGPSAPTSSKYVFDPYKCTQFDVEVYPGRWCCGFAAPDGKRHLVDGDQVRLATALAGIADAGFTLCGYNSTGYDIPVIRAVLAGEDPYPISTSLVEYDGPGIPPGLRDRAGSWPAIKADHIDLAARTRQAGHFPSLKSVGANLGARRLQELPYPPDRELTDAEWEVLKAYNRVDLDLTRAALSHFGPELEALATLSERFGLDLRNVHPAGVAGAILCKVYRDRVGRDPVRVAPPDTIRYAPPPPVRRPQTPTAAAWFDRLTTEEFSLALGQPLPVVPEPAGPIIVGGVTLTVGSGGVHSADKPALYRYGELQLYEADAVSFYPSMMAQFNFFPRALGDCGLEQFREILAERLMLKERAGRTTDKEEARRLKVQAHGLKLILNSLFGQTGNPYSALYDPTAFLAVTLSGQLLLIDLIERLAAAGAEVLSANTDGVYFRVAGDNDRWTGVIDEWESDTQMVLETIPVEALAIESTNNYATQQFPVTPPLGAARRRGTLSDTVAWNRVPNGMVIADAVCAALFDGTLPEVTVRACVDPSKFAYVTRRDRGKDGVLIDEATGTETPLPRLVRWYKVRGSRLRIEHRWVDANGKEHKTTPPGAQGIQLLPDLPAAPPGDIDLGWYVGAARARITANPDFPHLDPKWLAGHPGAEYLYNLGLSPSPKWDGKKSPRGAVARQPSYFWEWRNYYTFGTHTGPDAGILVLDIDEPTKFHQWVEGLGHGPEERWQTLADCLVSYHRDGSASAVRAGRGRGKLLFRFRGSATSPLARVGVAALRAAIGCEIFYGKGDPTVFGTHPDGPDREYLLAGSLGPPPDWLLADLVERASKKVRPASKKEHTPGGTGNGATSNPAAVAKYAKAALESEVAKVEAAPEGERNETIWKASCAIGGLIGAGALDRELAEERLIGATSLPPEEAADVIRRGLDRGAESPRDLGHVVGRNGDGHERPTIEISVEEHAVNDQAIKSLAADPDLYQRGHTLVRVLRDGPRPDDMECGRDPGGLTIMPVHTSTLRERLTKYAHWVRTVRGPDGEKVSKPAHPPEWSVNAVMQRGHWPGVRFLEGISETPLLRGDGTVLDTPGYDCKTGIFFAPEIDFPKVPDQPTREDARAAAKVLLDVVVDFPFKDLNHRAGWLSAVLTPFVRATLGDPGPLFLLDANTAGSGKTLLCDIISIVGTGRCVGRTTYPSSEEEMDKLTLALAVNGVKLVLFDNAATGAPIGGAALDGALTATTRSGRILGMTKFAQNVPFYPTFLATGNNVTLKGDIARRIVGSRLESPLERPEERDDFAIPRLLEYVRAHRGALAVAALTILRSYIVAGRPVPTYADGSKPKPMGAPFDTWANLVRRAVHWATDHDPLATKPETKATDRTATQLPALIEGWARLCRSCGEASLSTAAALKALEGNPEDHATLYAILSESTRDGKLPSPHGLGGILGKVRGRPHAGRSLERTETHGINQWFVKDSKAAACTPPVDQY